MSRSRPRLRAALLLAGASSCVTMPPMLRLAVALALIVATVAFAPAQVRAALVAPHPVPSASHQSTPVVDQHDDSRVGVQLVVAGVAAGVVVGVGTAAYLLRRRLGLTAYSPGDSSAGHH
jgi:hypothetical protein